MNTNALRQKILDLAIHGKLVSQDPADESATILLEKIRAEKEKKIASGELKRGKNDSYIFFGDDNRHYEKFADGRVKDIEDEIPFTVPEGWVWCRLGEVCEISSSKRVLQKDWKKSGIPFYRAREITQLSNNEKVKEDLFITPELYKEIKQKYGVPEVGDLLVSAVGTIGKIYIVNESDCFYYKDASVICFSKKFKSIDSTYLKLCCESSFIQKQMYSLSKGTTVDTITINKAQKYLFPLPPLAEQQRIVTAIETIIAQIDILETNKADLQTAIKQAKSKILDFAIRGKLVPQDPADEPASVMLEKLRAEKEAKIAAGEIKRGKNDSYIYKNSTDNCYYEKFEGTEEQIEIPFDLPEGWCWQKISSICEINPKNKLDNTLEISFVPMTLIDSEFNNNFTYELQRWENVKSGFSHFADNDIGIAKITPCFENRKSVIFKNLKNKYGAGTTELHILRTNNKYIFNEYVFWFIKTNTFIKEGINNFTGAVGQQRIGKEFIAETLIPIPPLNEQIKICRTINRLIKKLDKIALNII
ncbi:restriction endonuclease subunit S [Treponema denticola]|uniref:restriction endonuclease subunit S n=1 Tax=Treponema denticola TaxID=158 RepID=UPI0020A4F63E|nr:restriction endonuclease subunit S [Treponema denticola]UTC81710.1 restriction endonuclease subunit S [Treponema denticola]